MHLVIYELDARLEKLTIESITFMLNVDWAASIIYGLRLVSHLKWEIMDI